VGAAYGLHRKVLPHALILEEKQFEEDQEYEEEKRLLYVAITRARSMLVLGEGFSRQGGPWLRWMERLFENAQPGAIEQARDGKPHSVKFKGFSVKVLPASRLNVPEQLAFTADTILIGEPEIPRIPPPHIVPALDLTPSDLTVLGGCLRRFHWTRALGQPEPGRQSAGDAPHMRMGSIAHQMLETGTASSAELEAAGLQDLAAVFESPEWQEVSSISHERELPFIMYLCVEGKDCWIRGRMDVAIGSDVTGVPRVIDYKYGLWREGGEANYEMQMTACSLALMKASGTDRAIGELWYLKTPMKIVRREYTILEAEENLRLLLSKYLAAIECGEWPAADRAYCDRIECGFRQKCWGAA
jgi:CRISPR/Cas system-associated exonuclease Cas4 (RecB family)